MKRNNHQEKSKKPQNSKTVISDGIDVEYSAELADQNDMEAQARADAADRRAKNK